MKLRDWLTEHEVSDEAFADMVGGVSPHGVKKWRYGERTPRPAEQRRIAEVTNKAVTPNDFIGVASGDDGSEVAA